MSRYPRVPALIPAVRAATIAVIAPLLASCAAEQPVVVAVVVVDGASEVHQPYAATGQVGKVAASCDEIHAYGPELPSGLYSVQPPGSAAPFPVRCEMQAAGGGWTLVGSEGPDHPRLLDQRWGDWTMATNGQLRFLSADSGNPERLAAGADGLIGARFSGRYNEVMIDWGQSYVEFELPSFDIFGSVVSQAVPLRNFRTNDPALSSWVDEAGGALFCLASRDHDLRPGDTSWAVKPRNDLHTDCGCNSGNWQGRGAYYGGTRMLEKGDPEAQTQCLGFGGGWAGARDNGVPKGGVSPHYRTRIWVRGTHDGSAGASLGTTLHTAAPEGERHDGWRRDRLRAWPRPAT